MTAPQCGHRSVGAEDDDAGTAVRTGAAGAGAAAAGGSGGRGGCSGWRRRCRGDRPRRRSRRGRRRGGGPSGRRRCSSHDRRSGRRHAHRGLALRGHRLGRRGHRLGRREHRLGRRGHRLGRRTLGRGAAGPGPPGIGRCGSCSAAIGEPAGNDGPPPSRSVRRSSRNECPRCQYSSTPTRTARPARQTAMALGGRTPSRTRRTGTRQMTAARDRARRWVPLQRPSDLVTSVEPRVVQPSQPVASAPGSAFPASASPRPWRSAGARLRPQARQRVTPIAFGVRHARQIQ